MNISAMFHLHPLMTSEEMIFLYFDKFSGSDKIDRFGRGLLKEHFCKTFVKI